MSSPHAVQDAPSSGATGSDDAGVTGGQFCAVTVSSNVAVQGLPVCQDPPDALYPLPSIQPSENGPRSPSAPPPNVNDPATQHDEVANFLEDIALGFVFAGPGEAVPVTLFAGFLGYASQVAGEKLLAEPTQQVVDWASKSVDNLSITDYDVDASVPDASIGDQTGAQNPGQDGGTEIGVADPGETGGSGGHYVAPLQPGPDGPADPGEAGGGGHYVAPLQPGPDGPADPGEGGGGGGRYVGPLAPGPDPAAPGEGGGGGGLFVGGGGRGGSGGPVKEE